MAVQKHGVTADTKDRIIIDQGAVYLGFTSVDSPGTLLGATLGGNVFDLNRTFRDIRPDGSKGPVKGFRRREEVAPTLTCKLLELTEANLLKAIAGSSATSHVITGGEIDDNDYISNVTLVGTVQGKTNPIILQLTNCLVDSAFSLGLEANGEAVLEVKFSAHYDNDDLDTEPWSITYPES